VAASIAPLLEIAPAVLTLLLSLVRVLLAAAMIPLL
jgi:hypothetical protein